MADQISNISKNPMGTVSFDGKFAGMRKAQDFIVYPMAQADARALVQSDTRIGYIDLVSGNVDMSPSVPGGAYNKHLARIARVGKLSAEELLLLKGNIMATASGKAGSNGIVTVDNKGAAEVFNLQGAM